MINRVVLTGRLTKDPELRTTTTGKSVVSFRIAVDRRVKSTDGQDNADYINITAWNQTADFVSKYVGKGRLVAVDGRLQTRRYQDQSGQNREAFEVVADNVSPLDSRRDAGSADSYDDGMGDSTPMSSYSAPSGAGSSVAKEVAAGADEYDPFADS